MELKTVKEIIEDSDIPRDRVYELLRKKKISVHQTNGKKLYDPPTMVDNSEEKNKEENESVEITNKNKDDDKDKQADTGTGA